MFAQCPLNTTSRRKAPSPTFSSCFAPFKFGAFVVDIRVPNEIEVEPPIEVVALSFPGTPHADALAIKRLQNGILRSLLLRISFDKVPRSFADFVAHLHPHRPLR